MYADTLWEVLWPPFALDTWSFLTILSLLLLFTLLVNLELVIRSSEKLWNLLLQIPNLLESPITRIASLPWPLVNTAVYTFILMLLVALLSYGSFLSSLYLLIPFPSYLPHSLYLLIPFPSYLLFSSLFLSLLFFLLPFYLLFPFLSFPISPIPLTSYFLSPLSISLIPFTSYSLFPCFCLSSIHCFLYYFFLVLLFTLFHSFPFFRHLPCPLIYHLASLSHTGSPLYISLSSFSIPPSYKYSLNVILIFTMINRTHQYGKKRFKKHNRTRMQQ